MSELIVVENLSAIKVFTSDGASNIIDKIRTEATKTVPDISTAGGRKEVASIAHKVARSKVALDNLGKALVSDWKNKSKRVDAERKVIRDALDELRDEIRAPLTTWEMEEKARIEVLRLQKEIEEDYTAALEYDDLFNRRVEIERKEQEQRAKAEAEAEEKRQAEIKKVEAERIERIKKEAEERAKAEAERKVAEAEQAKIEAEEAARESEIRAKIEAENAERDRLAAIEFAEQEKLRAVEEAKKAAKIEAENAERDRLAAEIEKKRLDDIKAKNKEHRRKINNQSITEFIDNGISTDIAKKIITIIAKNLITNITINY